MIGVLLSLRLPYNDSAVQLAAEIRRASGDSALLLAVSQRAPGTLAIFLNVIGRSFEVAVLTLIP
jgi:hypothetical protein